MSNSITKKSIAAINFLFIFKFQDVLENPFTYPLYVHNFIVSPFLVHFSRKKFNNALNFKLSEKKFNENLKILESDDKGTCVYAHIIPFANTKISVLEISEM